MFSAQPVTKEVTDSLNALNALLMDYDAASIRELNESRVNNAIKGIFGAKNHCL